MFVEKHWITFIWSDLNVYSWISFNYAINALFAIDMIDLKISNAFVFEKRRKKFVHEKFISSHTLNISIFFWMNVRFNNTNHRKSNIENLHTRTSQFSRRRSQTKSTRRSRFFLRKRIELYIDDSFNEIFVKYANL